jgi:dTDP-D-glucose 4,6-dehydratase
MAGMGWQPKAGFEAMLGQTVKWTLENERWQLA